MASYRLLAVSGDSKTVKGEVHGYLTGIVYLIPSIGTGNDGANLCPFSTPGCECGCLVTAGRGVMSNVAAGRARKRAWFLRDRAGFVAALHRDIAALIRAAARQGLRPAVRLNGTSDIAWELLAPGLFAAFPTVTFYDYTKIPTRVDRYLDGKLPGNYALTFSRSEENDDEALRLLGRGGNVAVVFETKKGEPLPTTWGGFDVLDGDESDLIFLRPAGTVQGLRAKGKAKADVFGFVVRKGCA